MIEYIRILTIIGTLCMSSVIDVRDRIIPNRLVSMTALYGLIDLGYCFALEQRLSNVWINLLLEKGVGTLIAIIICFLCILIAKSGLGMGDVKLLIALGFTLGITDFIKALLLTSIISFLVSVFLLISHKADKESTLPFAPFLTVGVALGALINILSEVML